MFGLISYLVRVELGLGFVFGCFGLAFVVFLDTLVWILVISCDLGFCFSLGGLRFWLLCGVIYELVVGCFG